MMALGVFWRWFVPRRENEAEMNALNDNFNPGRALKY